MNLYRKICYKVEDFFITKMSKTEAQLKLNMEKADLYRKNKKNSMYEEKKLVG